MLTPNIEITKLRSRQGLFNGMENNTKNRGLMKSKLIVSLLIFLILIGMISIAYLISQINDRTALLTDSYATISENLMMMDNARSTAVSAEATSQEYKGQLETLVPKATTQKDDSDRLRSDLNAANLKLYEYTGLKCEDPKLMMDYSNNSVIAVKLQAYVSTLDDVQTVSYVLPERLYSNSLSQLYHVTYTNDGGERYSKRYIVYVTEFGWKKATFDLDNQCWLDAP